MIDRECPRTTTWVAIAYFAWLQNGNGAIECLLGCVVGAGLSTQQFIICLIHVSHVLHARTS
jgi:hypothetical protein